MAYYGQISDFEERRCFVWATERALDGRPRNSPEFIFAGRKFHLELSCFFKRYSLKIKHWPSGSPWQQCRMTVHLETRERQALPLSSYLTQQSLFRMYNTTYDYIIWECVESDILKAIPDFYSDGLMIFVVSCDKKVIMSLGYDWLKSVARGTQTDENVIRFAENPAEKMEKIAPTSLYLNAGSCLESLSRDLSKLFLDQGGSHHDVELKCGDRIVKAHRNVLSTRSPVFSTMLQSDTTEGRTGVVEFRDMDSDLFDWFVRYLYTGKLPELTNDTVRRLYEAGDKYAVEGLIRRCAHFMAQNLSLENACEVLAFADAHGDKDFKDDVVAYILDNKIPLQEDHWPTFCDGHAKLANEVLNRFYKMHITN